MVQALQFSPQPAESVTSAPKILRMVKNERMGGFVPAWVMPETEQEKLAAAMGASITPRNTPTFAQTLNETTENSTSNIGNYQYQEFGFGDLLDIINPLQHIPVVNLAYRAITGDEIRSSGEIVGGAIYGGVAGAASGIVNAIVKEETGDDIVGNALTMADLKPDVPAPAHDRKTEKEYYDDLPAALLAFAETPKPNSSSHSTTEDDRHVKFADERTAGTIVRYA